MYQLSTKFDIKPVTSAIVVAALPLGALVAIRAIFGFNMLNLLNGVDVVILLLQFGASYIVFRHLYYDDSPLTWLFVGALGMIIVCVVIPMLVTNIL